MAISIQRPMPPRVRIERIAELIEEAIKDKSYWEAHKIAKEIAYSQGWYCPHSCGQGRKFVCTLEHQNYGTAVVTITDVLGYTPPLNPELILKTR